MNGIKRGVQGRDRVQINEQGPLCLRFESSRLAIPLGRAHSYCMKTRIDVQSKLNDHGGATERGHEAWKRAKIERGLAQAQDRTNLIPMEKILRDFGLER